MKKVKILTVLIVSLIVINMVAAAWFFVFNSDISIKVESLGSVKDVTLDIPHINLNTTNSSDHAGGEVRFLFNREGTFLVNILETSGDLSAGECKDYQNDCEMVYELYDGRDTVPLIDKRNITIPSNRNDKIIYANISCIAYSCPQTKDISIKLTQIG